eukprot:gene35758-44094_t
MTSSEYIAHIKSLPHNVNINLLDPNVVDRALGPFQTEMDTLYTSLGLDPVKIRAQESETQRVNEATAKVNSKNTLKLKLTAGSSLVESEVKEKESDTTAAIEPQTKQTTMTAAELKELMGESSDEEEEEDESGDEKTNSTSKPTTASTTATTSHTTSGEDEWDDEVEASAKLSFKISKKVISSVNNNNKSAAAVKVDSGAAETMHIAAISAIPTITNSATNSTLQMNADLFKNTTTSSSIFDTINITSNNNDFNLFANHMSDLMQPLPLSSVGVSSVVPQIMPSFSLGNKSSKATAANNANSSRIKLTLNGTATGRKAKPQPAPRAPVDKPVSQNTVKVSNTSSSTSTSTSEEGGGGGVEGVGERKCGTRGIKLSAKFLRNAMDVDFLEDNNNNSQYQQQQPVKAPPALTTTNNTNNSTSQPTTSTSTSLPTIPTLTTVDDLDSFAFLDNVEGGEDGENDEYYSDD